MKNRIAKIVVGVSIIFVASGGFVFAQSGDGLEYNLLAPLPKIGAQPGIQTTTGLDDYLSRAIPFIIALAAVLAVVQITVGGFEYSLSEAITNKSDAKDRITQAIVGLLLALTSWLILNTINPDLVQLKLPIPKLSEVGVTTSTSGNIVPQVGASCENITCTDDEECIVAPSKSVFCQKKFVALPGEGDICDASNPCQTGLLCQSSGRPPAPMKCFRAN